MGEVAMKRIAYIRITVLLAVMLVDFSGCKGAREGKVPQNSLATAEETVKAYCDLDGKGIRLTSETWSKVMPYITWTEEAGWDRTIVIADYRIAKSQKQSDSATTVSVEYQILGDLSGDYTPLRRTETIKFQVKKTRDGWKITDPDFMPPHVLLKPMVKHLEGTKNLELAGKLQAAPKE
jgi:hypothetical protein